jgi:hypothetical protein
MKRTFWEAAMVCYRVPLPYGYKRTEKKAISQESRGRRQESKEAPLEYMTEVLPFRVMCLLG